MIISSAQISTSATPELLSLPNDLYLNSQVTIDARKTMGPLPTITRTVLTGVRSAGDPLEPAVSGRDKGEASAPLELLLAGDPCAEGHHSQATASPILNDSGPLRDAPADILSSTEQSISQNAFTVLYPRLREGDASSVYSAEEPQRAPQTPRVTDSSFSLYLTRSAAERQAGEMEDGEEEEGGEQAPLEAKERASHGGSQLDEAALGCSELGDIPSCSHFSLELQAYEQKIAFYTDRLRSALCDHKGIFSPGEESEIWGLLGGIAEDVTSLRCLSHDTQLQAYISTARKAAVRSRRFESKLIRLTQEAEAVMEARRDGLQKLSRELQQERAGVQSILLRLSESGVAAGRTEGKSPGGREFSSGLNMFAPEGEWDIDATVGISPGAEVVLGEGGISTLQNDADGDTLSLKPFPRSGSADERRQWICDHALGYFLSCKEPTTPECACSLMAHAEPHVLANAVLRCKRQMSIVSNSLISRCPGALSFHYCVLAKRMDMLREKWGQLEDECNSSKDSLLRHSL